MVKKYVQTYYVKLMKFVKTNLVIEIPNFKITQSTIKFNGKIEKSPRLNEFHVIIT